MLAATDATIGFEAPVPASRMAWEGAKLSLMAPNRPERRSESVTDNPAKNGADSIRVHSSRENFLERSTLFSLIIRDGTPILPKQNLKVRLETGMRQTYLELDATLDPNFLSMYEEYSCYPKDGFYSLSKLNAFVDSS